MPTNTKQPSAAATPYTPNWEQAKKVWASTAEHGKALREAVRHQKALQAAIRENVKNPVHQKKLLKRTSVANAKRLAYMNPFARLIWTTEVMKSFCAHQPKPPLYAVTLISNAFEFGTGETDPTSYVNVLKAAVEAVMTDCGASSLGNIEFAVFPKTATEDGGYRIAGHFQGIAWGVPKKDLKRSLALIFPPLADGTPGAWVIEVKRSIWNVVSYNLKAPAYGYRSWPRAGNSAVHNSMEIPLRGHCHLLRLFSGITWPQLAIATGKGKKILRDAQHASKQPINGQIKSPPADFLKAGASENGTASDLGTLTVESGVHTAIDVPVSEVPLQERTAEAAQAFLTYEGQRKTTKTDLHAFLQQIYGTALSSVSRIGELQQLVHRKGLTFNRSADLFALCLKLAIPNESYNKRRASDWAMALRYLYSQGCQPNQVLHQLGQYGVKACARFIKQSQQPDEHNATSCPEDVWGVFKKYGEHFTVSTNQLEMPFSKAILIAERNEDLNRLIVQHGIDERDPAAQAILAKLAKSLAKEKRGGPRS